MEEIEYKLKQNNAILITEAISKLIEKIKNQKSNHKNVLDVDIKELQFLKAKCGIEDTLVSVTASHGIVYLVEEGILSAETTLTDLMVHLSYAKFQTGIFTAIGKLLLLAFKRDVEIDAGNYICPYKMHKPQHPLITLLIQNSDMWREILNQIQLFMNYPDEKNVVNAIKLLRPLFYYVYCDPFTKSPDPFRRQLWNVLLQNSDIKECQILISELVLWMQIKSKKQCLETHDFLINTLSFIVKNGNYKLCESLIIYSTSLIYELVKYGSDPSQSIALISEMLRSDFSPLPIASVLLMILADTINICPPIYLENILRLSKIIISKRSSNIFAVKCLVASFLQLLFNPSKLLSEEIKIIQEIISLTEDKYYNHYSAMTKKLTEDRYFAYVQNANTYVDFIVKLNIMAEKWQSQIQTKTISNDKNKLLLESWLDYVFKNMPAKSLKKYFTILSAIFINDHNNSSAIIKRALDILLKLLNTTDSNTDISYNILILILYKLSNETDPELMDALLKALPLLAISKHNIPIIVNTLESLRKSPTHLKTYSFALYLDLWNTDVRCFPYLQKLLVENENSWEFGVAKAHTLREICVRRPVVHGKEMVVHLSQILNKYKDENGRIASSLALDGITVLCEAVIIDIISTWRTLAPRLEKENHPIIIKSLCEFFAQFSNLRCVSKKEEQIVSEIINKLWTYVASSEDAQVIEPALKALSCFLIGQMSLKQIPNKYKENLEIPPGIVKTPLNTDKIKLEDVLTYIPGECWIQLLEKVPPKMVHNVGNMLIEWTRVEIAEYNSGVYYISENTKKEPKTYNTFPRSSIVKALVTYLHICNVDHPTIAKPIVMQILRILGQAYSKPLPPLDWKFLSALFQKNPEYECLCINLLCKQLLISSSAIIIVKNCINTFAPDMEKVDKIRTLFTNLNYLCKAVPPDTLRPFIVNTLDLICRATEINDDLCTHIANNIKSTIIDEDIQESNRSLLGQIVESFAEQLNSSDKMFDIFLPCILNASSIHIDRLTSPSLWWNGTEDKFEKGVKLRCALAIKMTENPLACLTECINTAATMKSVQLITLNELSHVFRHHYQHTSTADWILKFLGGVQEKLIVQDKKSKEIVFLCDVLLIAVIIFSNLDVLYSPVEMISWEQDARLDIFPNALYVYVSNHQTITSQVLEWLYHMINSGAEIPLNYKITFSKSLTMLRHEKAFCDSSKWMKYVSVKL